MWTTRNWVIRSLQAAGSIASGYQFAFSERGIARGIASFNGQVVPAAQLLWPDGTINQLNRISDFGFQTNKLVPQESADVLVAFFPIDRFLTPGLKKIFLKSPAAFFVPGAMLADPKVKEKITSNMSQRAAAMLTEEMEYLGPAKRSVVEAKQQEIVDVVRMLEDRGEIDLNAINEEEEMVQ